MSVSKKILLGLLILSQPVLAGRELFAQSFEWKGQLVGWSNLFDRSSTRVQAGIRYLPSLGIHDDVTASSALDVAITANAISFFQNMDGGSVDVHNELKLYRYWLRFSTSQFEMRVGNQKINFGSAKMLRPLMWFDQIDPRDPIQFTEGVKALLLRYYFLNNANFWLWGLYNQSGLKGLEFFPSKEKSWEFGSRLQFPLFSGELAFSYHHRTAALKDQSGFLSQLLPQKEFPENRYALDGHWDIGMGIWCESAFIHYENDWLVLNWQKMITIGADYTFGIGNGLYLMGEHFMQEFSAKITVTGEMVKYSGLSVQYPLGLLDRVGLLSFYDWQKRDFYHYLNWQRTYDRLSLNISLFYMPVDIKIFGRQNGADYGGKGIRVMLIFDY